MIELYIYDLKVLKVLVSSNIGLKSKQSMHNVTSHLNNGLIHTLFLTKYFLWVI